MAEKMERNDRTDHDIGTSRYVTPQGAEAEFEPGSHGRVLRNRLHIRRKSEMDQVARCLAEVHAELLLIHPFREGNGRLARWVADIMAFQVGLLAPDYGFRRRGEKKRHATYLEAVRRGYLQDYEPLTAFFVEALERRCRKRPCG